MEDENTSYQGLAPVNKPMNMVCRFVQEGADSEAVRLHRDKVRDVFWMTKDGMTATGTNGSQTWDCAFITQAIVESGLANDKANQASLVAALGFLDRMQIRQNPMHYETAYRHRTNGAWPFSTHEQGYTVSDCTAEALKSVLLIQDLECGRSPRRSSAV
jgi:lanosterol synthase